MTEEITKYTTDSGVDLALSPSTVRSFLANGANVTDQDVVLFIELCRAHKLNPFLKEAYLIKYGNGPANIVTGKEAFTKRAERHPEFDGFEAGVTILTPGGEKIVRRDGELVLDGEALVGGWARIHRKDRSQPLFVEKKFSEYDAGSGNWKKMPGTMIRKVALVAALRETFPETFSGLYSPEEMGTDPDTLDAPPRQREPIQAEIVEQATPRDYTLMVELKARWAETFDMPIEDAARQIVSDWGNPSHMTDDEYEAMIAGVQKALDNWKPAEPVPDLSEMDEVPF